MLREIDRLVEELGEVPSAAQMSAHGDYSQTTYQRRFGSWNEAIEAAGYEPNSQRTKPSEEALLAELRRLADEVDGSPTNRQMAEEGEFSKTTYRRHFGSWNAALEAAGFETRPNPARVSKEELAAEPQRLADDLGKRPLAHEMDEHGRYSRSTYQRKFGSWTAALEYAFD